MRRQGVWTGLVWLLLSAGCEKPVELLWTQATEGSSRCTPSLTEDLVLFGNESGYVNAFSKDGVHRWRFPAHQEVISTPAFFEGKALFGSVSNLFYAIDASTGQEVWRFPARDRIKGDPLVLDGVVYFGAYDKKLYALDARNGALKWVFPAPPSEPGAPSPVEPAKGKPSGTKVIKTSGHAQAALVPAMARTSKLANDVGDFSYAQPVAVDGTLYVGNLDGHLYALDAQTGELKWRFKTGGGISSTVWAQDGVLYFGSNDHKVYALDAKTQKPLWTFETQENVNSSPRVSDGVLYVGGVDKIFYALDAKTGAQKWKMATGGRILGGAAFYQNLVFFGSGPDDGNLYAVQKATGERLWSYATGSKIDTDPVIEGNRLFLVAGDGRLFAFQINKTTK